MPSPSSQARAPFADPAQFGAALKRWLRENSREALISAIVGAILGYVANIALLHVVARSPAAFDGSSNVALSLARSSVFCGVCSTVLFALLGYRLAVGGERFARTLGKAPGNIARLFRRDGRRARVHLLWGATVSFVLMQFVTPLLGVALSVALLAAAPSIVGRVLADLGARLFASASSAVGPTRAIPIERSLAMVVGMVGSAVALVAGLVVVGAGMKLALAAACAVVAFALARSGGPSPGTRMLLVIGAGALLAWTMGDPLLAQTSERPIPGEMGRGCALGDCSKPGHEAHRLFLCGLIGAIFAGLAAPFGFGIGRVAAEFGGGWGDLGDPAAPVVVAPPATQPLPPETPPARRAAPSPPPPTRATPTPSRSDVDRANDLPDVSVVPSAEGPMLRDEDGTPVRIRRLPGTDLPSDLPSVPQVDVGPLPVVADVADMVRTSRGLIDRVEDPERQQFLRDFLDRQAKPDATGGYTGDPAAVERAARAIRDQTFGADQQRQLGESEEALGEADAQRDSERFSERVRDWSLRVNRGLAHLDPTGTGHKIVKAEQGVSDAVKGFEEDGLRGAIGRTAANALDDHASGVGTTIYEGSLSGASATEMAMDYAQRRRAEIDPTLAAARIGDAAGRLAEGDGVDALGDLVDAGQDLADMGARLRDRARRRADGESSDESSEHPGRRGTDETPAATADGSESPEAVGAKGVDTAGRSRDLEYGLNKRDSQVDSDDARQKAWKAQEDLRAAERKAQETEEAAEKIRASRENAKAAGRDMTVYDRAATIESEKAAQARADLEAARSHFDQAREDWLNADPRRAVERATEAQMRAKDYLDHAETDAKAAQRTLEAARGDLAREPDNAAKQAELARAEQAATEADARVAREKAANAEAIAAEDAAVERFRVLEGIEKRSYEKTANLIKREHELSGPTPDAEVKIAMDRTELERQALAAERTLAQERNERLGRDPTKDVFVVKDQGGAEIAVDPAKVTSTVDATTGAEKHFYTDTSGRQVEATRSRQEIPDASPKVEPGMEGFFYETADGKKHLVSKPDGWPMTHEVGHALTHEDWRKYASVGLNEGVNEMFTQQTGTSKSLNFPKTGYPAEVRAATALNDASNGTLKEAFYNGNMDALCTELGKTLGKKQDNAAALDSGRTIFGKVNALMAQGKPDEALAYIEVLKLVGP